MSEVKVLYFSGRTIGKSWVAERLREELAKLQAQAWEEGRYVLIGVDELAEIAPEAWGRLGAQETAQKRLQAVAEAQAVSLPRPARDDRSQANAWAIREASRHHSRLASLRQKGNRR